MGTPSGAPQPRQIFAHDRRRPHNHDLLLYRREPHDGHGAGPRRRHPPALHVLWRFVDANHHDVHWHNHGHQPPAAEKRQPSWIARQYFTGLPYFWHCMSKNPMLTARLTRRFCNKREIFQLQWTHSSGGKRSEERRYGKEGGGPLSSRWGADHYK